MVQPGSVVTVVSIHASVKDATSGYLLYLHDNYVSIHASVKDATWFCSSEMAYLSCFNPRICKRCDGIKRRPNSGLMRFNPRICKRCDSSHSRSKRRLLSFNPRICKRCDCFWSFCYPLGYCFNPRICKRCDKTVNAYLFTVNVVSIHASVKDATLVIIRLFLMVSFNPRICKRCDIRFWYWWRLSLVSIHASVKDATPNNEYGYETLRFQSTHL